jgi:hypothetical protein
VEYKAKIIVLLLLAAAVPATAQTFGFSIGPAAPCLSIGGTAWRVAGNAGRADVTVRIDSAAPDIRIEMAETPDAADFVFVDDGAAPPGCQASAGSSKSGKIDPAAPRPDLTVGFATSTAPADYRLYVRSRWVSPDTAAALFAAARMPGRTLADRR